MTHILTRLFGKAQPILAKAIYSEERYYSWSKLTSGIITRGQWNTIDISKDQELIAKVWDNHLSKMTKLNYYLSESAIECTCEVPRGTMFLRWRMPLGTPMWFEFGIYASGTRYDIHYTEDLQKCRPLYDWLVEKGLKFAEMYKNDKNL